MPDNLEPHIHRDQIVGIAGIDSSKLYYASWHFLNQALECFTNGANYSCLACLNASIELWLKRQLKSEKKLYHLITKAVETGLITKEEQVELDFLRKTRNEYLHFDISKLPKFKKWSKTYNRRTKKTTPTNLYPNEEFYDANPLAILPLFAYYSLNFLTEFYMKRYPKSIPIGDAYFKFLLINIEGLDEEKVIFKLKNKMSEKSTKKSVLKKIMTFFDH